MLGGGEWKGNYPLERCILPEKFSWRCLDCCMCLIEGNKQGSAAAPRNIKGLDNGDKLMYIPNDDIQNYSPTTKSSLV